MKSALIGVLVLLWLAGGYTHAGEFSPVSTNAVPGIELRDQFNALQHISFPTTKPMVLAIADRKGSDEVDGWIAALKPLHAGQIDIRGLADVSGVPKWLRAKVRGRFQEDRQYPVMLDWSGEVCSRFAYQRGSATILVIDRTGIIRARVCGKVNGVTLATARAALEAAVLPAERRQPAGGQ